jgi:hypothetical protein
MKPSNRLNLDYSREASRFKPIASGIIDIHSHIQGEIAAALYGQAAAHYGISLTYSMTPLAEIDTVRKLLGERIEFIAIPNFVMKEARTAFGSDFIRDLPLFRSYGARIAKFWNAPRIYEASPEPFAQSPFRINSRLRLETIQAAVDLGMICMAHIGDPDTWFATKYRDSSRYGTKLEQYEAFEEVLERYRVPWIAAHMGGYPEDLKFLSNLLTRHCNLYLDCSATKWIVRELSKHPPVEVRNFFKQWRGRLLFGSDIVTRDSHVSPSHSSNEMDAKASTAEEAYDLYASRYWALRTLLESSYEGESPIADPDLHLVDSTVHSPLDAPQLRGVALDDTTLVSLYRGAAAALLGHQS